MSEVRICPICQGSGKLKYGPGVIPGWRADDKECHSCSGKGFIIICEEKLEVKRDGT